MRHLAPSPTSEALRCSFAAACGPRRARRTAAIRFSASCLFISLKDTFFTEQMNTAIRSRRQIRDGTERTFLKIGADGTAVKSPDFQNDR